MSDDIVLGDISPERIAGAQAVRDEIYRLVDGGEVAPVLDGLMSAWLSLSIATCGLDGTMAAARELLAQVKRLAALNQPVGRA